LGHAKDAFTAVLRLRFGEVYQFLDPRIPLGLGPPHRTILVQEANVPLLYENPASSAPDYTGASICLKMFSSVLDWQ
jgi:hypothetical protein